MYIFVCTTTNYICKCGNSNVLSLISWSGENLPMSLLMVFWFGIYITVGGLSLLTFKPCDLNQSCSINSPFSQKTSGASVDIPGCTITRDVRGAWSISVKLLMPFLAITFCLFKCQLFVNNYLQLIPENVFRVKLSSIFSCKGVPLIVTSSPSSKNLRVPPPASWIGLVPFQASSSIDPKESEVWKFKDYF